MVVNLKKLKSFGNKSPGKRGVTEKILELVRDI
jgi:hypothetical protein